MAFIGARAFRPVGRANLTVIGRVLQVSGTTGGHATGAAAGKCWRSTPSWSRSEMIRTLLEPLTDR